MPDKMREGELMKTNTIVIFTGRITLLAIVLLLLCLGGFTYSEFQKLLYIILPSTVLYLTLAAKFTNKNRYLPKGNVVNKVYYYQGTLLPAIIYLIELVLILAKGLFNWVDIEVLYTAVFIIECGQGIYAGFYLSDLYAKKIIPDGGDKSGVQQQSFKK